MLFEDEVVEVIRSIPAGEVMTYGEVAMAAGYQGAARAVGNVVRVTAEEIPWWRVVGAGLRCISPDPIDQLARLRAEGCLVARI